MMCGMETVDRTILLNARDLRELAALHASAVYRAVLADLVGVQLSETSSEAEVLHAVWVAGLQAVRAQVEDVGYAEMAAERVRGARRRRRPVWADEP